MERNKAEQIANFRYQLISPIVCQSSLYFGESTELIRQAAAKIYQIPGSRKTRVSPRTIERYLKKYREGGYDALMPKTHTSTTRIPKEYLDLAISLKQENLKRPVTQIIEMLELSGKVPQGLLKRSTLYDHFDRLGLTKELGKKEAKAYQRFAPKHRNQRWQGDVCHLLHIPDPTNPKRKIKLYLIVWLDEASRIVTHGQLYTEEKTYALEDCLKKAIMKFGIPDSAYCDNGSIYSSHHLQRICGRLGINLSHTRPYKPQGRGKVERFFSSVQKSYLPEMETMLRERTMSVGEINEYFFIWLRQHYHEKVHSATKQKPMLSFEEDPYPLRQVDLATLVDAFLVEEQRTVDKTGVFRLQGAEYQAPLELARSRISVRYDPFEPGTVQVYRDNQRYSDAYLLAVPEHVEHGAVKETITEPTQTGINYLELLKQKDRQGLAYAELEE
ncbi:MAG: DDE-type integrase/transposase/recombinase [Bacillota bacterium]|nr:DDE-type integrase/transposase/recombinase [Bacillota bacterium]